MVRLRMLGAVDLRDSAGHEPKRLLAQPKRLALLVVLALAGRGKFVRRDRLLALFWPELDTDKARHALRQALYVLRGTLGADLIVSRGDEEVGVAADCMWCDVHAFEALLEDGRPEAALELYAGDLLPSFHVADVSEEFDSWLEGERARLRGAASGAAWTLAQERDAAGEGPQAMLWARRAVRIQPDDEAAFRRLLTLLANLGDRLGAMREFDLFARRLRDKYGLEPSLETRRLLTQLERREASPDNALPAEQALFEPRPERAVDAAVAKPSEPKFGSSTSIAGSRQRRVLATAGALMLLGALVVVAKRWPAATDSVEPAVPLQGGEAGSASEVALRLYEAGLRANYREDPRTAYRLFAAALDEDSTFALAAYHAGLSLQRRGVQEAVGHVSSRALIDRALRLGERAPERDRLIITLHHVSAERPRFAAVAESLAARYPTDPMGHLALARVRFAAGDFLSAVELARRGLVLDSLAQPASACNACDAYETMVNAYVYADSLAAAERVAREVLRLRPSSAWGWNYLHLVLGRQGRSSEAMAAFRRAEALEPDVVDRFAPVRMALLADDPATADGFIQERLRLGDTNAESLWWRLINLRVQGRLTEALSTARTLRKLDQENGGVAEAQVLFEMGRVREAASRFESLARAPRGSGAADAGWRARHTSWMLAHAATAWEAAGDTVRLARLADTVQAIAHLSAYGRDWRLPYHIRGLLWKARGVPDSAATEFRRALFSLGEGFTRTNLELARALLALRRPQEAVSILQPALRGSIDGANFYVTRTELHETLAQAFDMANVRDSAASHFAAVAAAWAGADPELRDRAKAAQQRIAQPPDQR